MILLWQHFILKFFLSFQKCKTPSKHFEEWRFLMVEQKEKNFEWFFLRLFCQNFYIDNEFLGGRTCNREKRPDIKWQNSMTEFVNLKSSFALFVHLVLLSSCVVYRMFQIHFCSSIYLILFSILIYFFIFSLCTSCSSLFLCYVWNVSFYFCFHLLFIFIWSLCTSCSFNFISVCALTSFLHLSFVSFQIIESNQAKLKQ